jgi:microcystin-dependent protein
MADPFVAEIRIFGFHFPPTGWAACDGQLLPLSQNTALFSLLGTYYGGDGKSTFALPDLRGSVPMHPSNGPYLSIDDRGEPGEAETVTSWQGELRLPAHKLSREDDDELSAPGIRKVLVKNRIHKGHPHHNGQAHLTMNFNIALQGIFPPRS